MTLTKQLIKAGANGTGGWNKHQLATLGIKWPPHSGWLRSLVGTEISEERYEHFLSQRRVHIPRPKVMVHDYTLYCGRGC